MDADKQEQTEDRAEHRDRIRAALADFFKSSLPAMRAKRNRQQERQGSLFAASSGSTQNGRE